MELHGQAPRQRRDVHQVGHQALPDGGGGEFPVGISYELAGVAAKQGNAPVEILVMEEGGGWDMDTAAIVKGTRNLEAARRLMDWAASETANRLYARFATMVAMKRSRPIFRSIRRDWRNR